MKLNLKNLLSNFKFNVETKSIPLRVWTKQRGLPTELKLEKYQTNIKNNLGQIVQIKRYAIWGKMETVEEYIKRKRHKKSKRWCKGSKKSSRRSFECKCIKNHVWIKLVSKWNNLVVKNRKVLFDRSYLRLKLKQNEIGVWYTSKDQQVRCLILPRFINLEKEFFELVGILDGEVCKRSSRKRNIVKISNTEPKIVKHMLDNFQKYFNLQIKDWSASITFNAKKQNITKAQINKIKQFWSNKTKLKLNKITKTTVNKRYISKFSPYGIIQIRYSNNILWNVLMYLINKIRPITLSNKNYTISYLRGLIAGEGGIGKDKKNRLRVIGIGGTVSEDKRFYMRCLDKINISSFKEYPLRVEIYHKLNFLRFYKLNLFGLHPQRKQGFIEALTKLKNINL